MLKGAGGNTRDVSSLERTFALRYLELTAYGN